VRREIARMDNSSQDSTIIPAAIFVSLPLVRQLRRFIGELRIKDS